MNDDAEHRLAANEDMARRVNEGIERGRWPGESSSAVGFRCECARLGCNMLLSLSLETYERVRAGPRRFVMHDGHELPAVERVIERRGEIVIVEKVGDAGREAAARNPRR